MPCKLICMSSPRKYDGVKIEMMKKKYKILMLNHEFPPLGGGGAYACRNILKQFAEHKDITVDVIISHAETKTVTEKFADNITLYKVGLNKKDIQRWKRTELIAWIIKAYKLQKHLISENDYDLAHAFFGFPAGILTWRTSAKVPYIISLRGSDVPGINVRFSLDYKILGPIFKRIWKTSSALYACSHGLRQRALNFAPHANIGVIPNGVELDRFTPRESGLDKESLKLLTVGRLSSSKRIDLLIEAVQIIRNKIPDVTMTIAGSGGLYKKLDQLVKNENLQNHIKMPGTVDAENMPGLYRQHDIFVTATAQEGMSNAMLEAMASGLPVITTRCEGVEELIADNGIIVEQPNSKAIAEAINQAVRDEQGYKAMCLAARKKAEQFTWEKAAEQYLKIYRNVLSK